MTKGTLFRTLVLLAVGAAIGAAVTLRLAHQQAAAPAAAQTDGKKAVDLEALQADVAHLKDITPSQSHSMEDVGYHMANLWFAAQKKNWALAAFEMDDTRNRIRWTIRINPIRKDPAGNPVDLKSIFDGIDNSSLATLKDAVDKKNSIAFVAAYKLMLESCYSCHKTSGKPYLRPMVPTASGQFMITYDPNARWPE